MDPRSEKIFKAADYIKERLDGRVPVAGIVLGSGLGKLAEKIENPIVIHYKDIPGFPVSTAIGHKGNYIAGELGGKFVIAMQGRIHYYEGYPMDLVTLPIRAMKVLGISYLFVSNAAGGINFDYKVGDLMTRSSLPRPRRLLRRRAFLFVRAFISQVQVLLTRHLPSGISSGPSGLMLSA